MSWKKNYLKKYRPTYDQIHKQIETKIRIIKENDYNRKCDEIQKLHAKPCNANGEIITDLEENLKTWKEYMEELFENGREDPNIGNRQRLVGPE